MQKEPNDLWVQVMQGKYGRGREKWELLMVKDGDSRLWKELGKIWDGFQENMLQEVRNGCKTKVWHDKWLDQTPKLMSFVPEGVEIGKDCRVSELLDEQGGWDLHKLRSFVQLEVLERIQSLAPLREDEDEDTVRWKLTVHRHFSTASGYAWILGTCEEGDISLWKNIWKLKVLERVWVFIWQVNHKRLATKSITSKGNCNICHRAEEDQMHAICSHARMTWSQLIPSKVHTSFFREDWTRWLTLNLQNRGRMSMEATCLLEYLEMEESNVARPIILNAS